jgi:hypothetical protein
MRLSAAKTAALLGVGVFAVYAALAARDMTFGDGPELTAAAVTNGVVHPPGYPLWILLGHLATFLPIGTLPFRVNLTACAYHALAVAIVFLTAFVLTRGVVPALFAALLLAIGSPLFVSWSLQAEVFSLNDLFAAAIVLLCVLWLEHPRRWRFVVPLGALFGLGLANHQSLLLLAPLPIYAAWCGRSSIPVDRRTFAVTGLAAALFLLGFALPYAHTLVVSQRLTGWHMGAARSLPELVDVIDRRVFGTFNLVPNAVDRGATFFERVVATVGSGGWPYAAICLGLLDLQLGRRYRELVLAGLVIALPLLAFCAVAGIDVTDESLRAIFARFGLMPLTALAPFAACGGVLLENLAKRFRLPAAAADGVLGALVALSALALPSLSLAHAHAPRNLVRDIARALPERAILMTAGDSVDGTFPYFQSLEGLRPDVTTITYGLLNLRAYREALAQEITVPEAVGLNFAPQARRDLLVRANRGRPFYTVGERGIHAPGPLYYPSVIGIVSRMTAQRAHVDLARRYAEETALEHSPGYAQVSADRWLTNGFGSTVREYYAGGFFSTGADAERLSKIPDAIHWYERARAYSSDPLIELQLQRLHAAHD